MYILSGVRKEPAALYTNPTFNFTLTLPPGFAAYPPDTRGASTTGEAVVFQSGSRSIQLTVIPYQYQDATLTPDDLAQEAPYLAPSNLASLSLSSGIQALSFTDPATSQSEVWFVSRGYLYQFTADSSDAALLQNIALSFNGI